MAKEAKRGRSGQGGARRGGRDRARSKGSARSVNAGGLDHMVESLRRFARRHPVALIGGAVLVGLALGTAARTSGRVRSASEIGAWAGRHWKGTRVERRPGRGAADVQDGAGERSLAPPSRGMGETAGAPAPAQGYTGGVGTGAGPSPNSATDVSLGSSGYTGGGEPGAISTGSR